MILQCLLTIVTWLQNRKIFQRVFPASCTCINPTSQVLLNMAARGTVGSAGEGRYGDNPSLSLGQNGLDRDPDINNFWKQHPGANQQASGLRKLKVRLATS